MGRAIIEYIEGSFAGKAELLTTQPDEEAIGFYRKLGFHEVLYENWLVEVPPTAKSSGGQCSAPP
ncbi:GNAT family N-acetyltransferase [Thermococcus sp. JCM 11816]|uniref:GNAT family N-acetyltransferase n=1 Tax=Thermococcus sp. (strain JCM 11816 / KS-1) TaxID=1295125 RepID=UPI0034674365